MNHGIIMGGVVDYYYDSIKRAPGAHKIATHLRREGWNVEVLDFVQSWTLEELQEFARQRVTNKTKFLGLSATFSIRFKNLFENVKKNNVLNINDADYFLCTGLFDNYDSDLNYYKNLL